ARPRAGRHRCWYRRHRCRCAALFRDPVRRNYCEPWALPISYQLSDDVDGQSEYRDIEEETHHAMGKHDTPQITALDLHIRHLKGHADAEGKIHEIPIVGLLLAGEVEPADGFVFIGRVSITIVAVSVMQSENRIHKKP